MMKHKNLLLRYFGFLVLILCVVLNFKIFLNEEWPTILFLIFGLIGIAQMILSVILKPISGFWQILLSVVPFVLVYIYLKF